MAGVGAREIKRKIKSVGSTMQITKAMKLVATAKLKRSRDAMEQIRPFFGEILNTVGDILYSQSAENHAYITRKEIKNTLIILITSDRGLCGGYNTNVIKKAEAFLESNKNCKIIAIGRKSSDYFTKRGYEVVESMLGISEKPTFADAQKIGSKALELYLNHEVDEIKLVYTQMKSAISQISTMIGLLPVELSEYATQEELDDMMSSTEQFNFEPSAEIVMNNVIPEYINSVIHGALVESAASEQSARRNAMDSASSNAQEMIDSLTLSFNQARQGAITQEINEIVSGANALEG